MEAFVGGVRLRPDARISGDEKELVLFIPTDRLKERARLVPMDGSLSMGDPSKASRFESRAGFDCLLLNIPDEGDDVEARPMNIDIYIAAERIVFVYDSHPAIDRLKARMEDGEAGASTPFHMVPFLLLADLATGDADLLNGMEEEIAAFEDEVDDRPQLDAIPGRISTLRRVLIKQKRYFESLLDALEDMEENQNHLLSGEQLGALRLATGRAERHLRSVLNLRDYVTQVRESYQAQMDIQLNRTMKLFTVVTTVFLPLTVLAGWYGMNFDMPEYAFEHAYPVLIAVTVASVGLIIAYFKRHGWF